MSSFSSNEPTTDETERGDPKKKSNIKYKRLKEEYSDDENKDQKRKIVNEAYDRHNSLKF